MPSLGDTAEASAFVESYRRMLQALEFGLPTTCHVTIEEARAAHRALLGEEPTDWRIGAGHVRSEFGSMKDALRKIATGEHNEVPADIAMAVLAEVES